MVDKIHIGTSGWSYKHWKENFYPKQLNHAEWLSFYAGIFDITEINTSFYRLPAQETVGNWMKMVPKKFLFCPKMSRFLTHMKKLHDPEEPLQRFFDVFKSMKKQMGPVLMQLPRMVKFKPDVAEHLFKLLKRNYTRYEFVLEVRHPTWLEKDSLRLLTKYEIGLVISQSGNRFPYAEIITAKNIYIRFHGPEALYASSYKDKDLKYFAKKFSKWVKEGHEIWTFFNNDINGHAPKDALRLKNFCR